MSIRKAEHKPIAAKQRIIGDCFGGGEKGKLPAEHAEVSARRQENIVNYSASTRSGPQLRGRGGPAGGEHL